MIQAFSEAINNNVPKYVARYYFSPVRMDNELRPLQVHKIERCIYNSIIYVIGESIFEGQYGFTKGKSTITQ